MLYLLLYDLLILYTDCYCYNDLLILTDVTETDSEDEGKDEPTEEEIKKWKEERKREKARRVSLSIKDLICWWLIEIPHKTHFAKICIPQK